MSNIIDSIKGQLNDETIANLSKQMGESTEKVKAAIDSLLPTITKTFSDKLSSDGSFMSNLDTDGDGDVDLNDLTGFFNNASQSMMNMVNQLFGDKKEEVAAAAAQESGMSQENTANLMEKLTGMVSSNLNKAKEATGAEGVLSMLTKEAGSLTEKGSEMVKDAMNMLDEDGDGKVDLDDIKKKGRSIWKRLGF